jgi:hypothetical protein
VSVRETMDAWGREHIMSKNPGLEIPEGASIRFDDGIVDSWGGCETCGDGGPSYEVEISYTEPYVKGKRSHTYSTTWDRTFVELLDAINDWEEERRGGDSE